MNVIQVKSNEVFEGMLHGYMHKGLNDAQQDQRNNHTPPDVIYISTSDRAADFEVRGILRKSTIPDNFIVSGYSSLQVRVRGRSLNDTSVFISPECLHVDRDLLTGSLAELIEHRTAHKWVEVSTMIVHGPSSHCMPEGLQERLYQNYLGRNPMFHQGIVDMRSNTTPEQFAELVAETATLKSPQQKRIRAPLYFGDEFMSLDMKQFYKDLLVLHPRMPAGDSLVFSPALLFRVYSAAISYLRLPITTL